MKCDAAFVFIAILSGENWVSSYRCDICFKNIVGVAFAADEDITFAVRTRQRRSSQDFKNSIDLSKINPKLPFKFITHGWVDWGNNSWIQNLSNAFLDRGNYNVIPVNWHNLAQQTYVSSARATRKVGNDKILNGFFSFSLKNFKEKQSESKLFICITKREFLLATSTW